MIHDGNSPKTKRWFADPLVIILLVVHTALASTVVWIRNPSDPGHLFPCILFLDLPSTLICYYATLAAARLFSVSDPFSYEGTVYLWWIGLSVIGGAQWILIVTWPRWWRRSRAPLPGYCRKCGYDLTGNVSGICPECGTEIEQA